eukprot:gnl/MRDRNA2_/MRDRNA2_33732_c0_seq1.p1 gnl/MRDRNA2_/MRDRNA2_33732_c0~~gnl/MRDRNA2_/MRDRNA2_33732_c0_seq1.p1  ORF type:complete len:943 (-),score=211.95 gnl/MRDRNA2_/MRDRNA2_33732_c0_seq1:16-2844(-)
MGCGASSQPAGQTTNKADDFKNAPVPVETPPEDTRKSGGAKASLGVPQEPENEPSGADVVSDNGVAKRSNKPKGRIMRRNSEDRTEGIDEEPEAAKADVNPQDRRVLCKVLQNHFLFAGLEDDERNAVIDRMERKTCAAEEVIFKQKDEGDCCYLIQSGVFNVIIDNRNLKQLRAKHTFGELAMLYNVKRTATVACSHAGVIWKMSGQSFRRCMALLSGRHLAKAMGFLNSDSNFSKLKEEEKKLLAAACSVQEFGTGDQILREGEVGDWMFIVMVGKVVTTDQFGNKTTRKAGAILGGMGLMYSKKQIFGAKAVDKVTCLALGKSSLERLIGPVEDVLRRSAIKALLENLDFFKKLTNDQQNAMIGTFEDGIFDKGECIVSRGARAQFILVMDGEVGVLSESAQPPNLKQAEGDQSAEGADGQPVSHTLSKDGLEKMTEKTLRPGTCYGEENLLENTDMPTFLVAATRVRVHRIGYDMLSNALNAPLKDAIRVNEIKKVLQDIFLFKSLYEDQIDRTVKALQQRKYKDGEHVVQQGEPANHFYLIQSGVVRVMRDGKTLRTLGKWDYFGERGLLLQEKRSATCQAEGACVCLVLDSEVFTDIVGMFKTELEHRIHLQDLNIKMSDLRTKAIVGRGTFGIVKLVHHKADESKVYALKCVNKKQVVRMMQQKSIQVEREINAQCYHPCIMQFIKTFQDQSNVYFLTEFLGGGDLFFAIREIGMLTKQQTQFYSGSIILALENLHERGIMYRDLKPENVLLDFQGNTKMVDFGCCKKALRSYTLVGTPEYLAPEVILGKGYTCAVDWWSLGVMMYEFVCGPLPFGHDTEDQLELFREILEAPLQFPEYVTDESALGLVSSLLERTPELRTGSSTTGAKEIKEHAFFGDFDWDAVAGRYMTPPWKPDTNSLMASWEHVPPSDECPAEDQAWDGTIEAGMEWAEHF